MGATPTSTPLATWAPLLQLSLQPTLFRTTNRWLLFIDRSWLPRVPSSPLPKHLSMLRRRLRGLLPSSLAPAVICSRNNNNHSCSRLKFKQPTWVDPKWAPTSNLPKSLQLIHLSVLHMRYQPTNQPTPFPTTLLHQNYLMPFTLLSQANNVNVNGNGKSLSISNSV